MRLVIIDTLPKFRPPRQKNIAPYDFDYQIGVKLKEFADANEGLVNGAMRYDTDNLEPLYQLEVGHPGSSFAFEIARKIGLHPSLLNYARGKLGTTHVDYEKMLTELESDKIKYKKQLKDLGEKEAELIQLREDYEALKKMLEAEKKKVSRKMSRKRGH